MNPRAEVVGALEPDQWFVVFHREAPNWWLSLIALGKFKHVSAVAYCTGFKLWLVYDTELNGTRLMLLQHNPAGIAELTRYMRNCTVVRFDRKFGAMGLTSRLGFYCVPAIKHLIGVHCAAVRPDGLYRAILRNGGVLINEGISTTSAPTAAARSDVGDGERASASLASH